MDARWVGAAHPRGHRLRDSKSGALPATGTPRRVQVLIIGAGIAGLAAARGFMRRGVHDVHVLELEDTAGGNSRGHLMGAQPCPLGAHYLPLPGPQASEVAEWLHEIGLMHRTGGRSLPDERHLCHSPQERLFFDGVWHAGLLPPAEPGTETLAQYRRFAQAVHGVQSLGFALPSSRAPWTAAHAALDAVTFADWLAQRGFDDAQLRWYLDYCCRDDYGADSQAVSAWAGLHYFASRHGFSVPGDEAAEREGVFTWPEGNAWLVRRLAAPLGERLHTGCTVMRVAEARHEVQVWAHDEATGALESWSAETVVLAVPLVVAARVLQNPMQALKDAAQRLRYAPWLVANLQLDAPLLARPGAAPAWDSVAYGGRWLGYVDAQHQSLNSAPGATVITAYHVLQPAERAALLQASAAGWAGQALAELAAVHPDVRERTRRIDLMRWGHAMAIPAPGVRGHPALQALRAQRARLRFAHADLAGSSVFEESFTLGMAAAAG
jgi:monoamine oxidase